MLLKQSTLFILSIFTLHSAYADVSIIGVEGIAADNVRVMLSLTKEKCDAPRWKIEQLFNTSEQNIQTALHAVGFYQTTIEKSLSFNKECWQANYKINAGTRTTIDSIDLTINGDAQTDAEFKKLREKFKSNIGQGLQHNHYEKIKSQLASLAAQRGYLKHEFTRKKLLIDKANNKARIELVFNSGKRQKFGVVTIEQDILDAEFVAKFVHIKQGEFYSSEQLSETYDALSKSGYFDEIDIRPATESTDQFIPVTIKLHLKPKQHYAFGIGFDTDIGILASAAYKNTRLNEYGHFLNAELDISPILSTANVEYSVPLEDPLNETFSIGAGLKRENTDSFKALSAKFSTRLKYLFDSGWRQNLFFDYGYEDFKIGTEPNHALLMALGGGWLYSAADDAMRPNHGYRLKFDAAGGVKTPFSDVTFAQGSASATLIESLWSGGKFIGRIEQGATFASDFDKLPATYRFYAGGLNSIRGYTYKELGPKDSAGNVIGGKFLSLLSVEYEHTLFDDWGIAAFVDTGNAYNLNNISVKTGAGIGARWYSPFGPVRVDFAVPLDDANSSFQIHFAAGARL